MQPKTKPWPGQGDPDDCSRDVAGSPQNLLLPLPRGPHEEGALLKGEGGRCRRGPSASRGLPPPSPMALPLPLLHPSLLFWWPPSPRAASGPPRGPCLQGARVKQAAWAGGKGLAWHPCLKGRSSTAHFLPQERWQRLGIMDDPSLTSPLHPSGPLPAAEGGGGVSGVAPPSGNAGGSKNRKLFQRTPSCSFHFNGRGDLCAPPLPHPHPVSSKNAWQWHPGSGPSAPHRLEGGALATHLCLGHALAGSWWKLTGPFPCSGGGGRREERFAVGGAARQGLKSHFLREEFPPLALQLPRWAPPPSAPEPLDREEGALLNPGSGCGWHPFKNFYYFNFVPHFHYVYE